MVVVADIWINLDQAIPDQPKWVWHQHHELFRRERRRIRYVIPIHAHILSDSWWKGSVANTSKIVWKREPRPLAR
jgi:hypothetical protein